MQVCRCYGFTGKQSCPIVYTLTGRLVGDAHKFVEEVRSKYLDHKPVPTNADSLLWKQDNIRLNNEEMRKKKKGATLEEKVKKHLEKVKKKGAVAHMIDTFFAPV